MKETVTMCQGDTKARSEGEVVPYVPGSSDPAGEDFWDRPDAHRVEYHLTTGERDGGQARKASGGRSGGAAGRSRAAGGPCSPAGR